MTSSGEIPITVVNAFSGNAFGGNPAAVCRLARWPSDETLRKLAVELCLPITSFMVREDTAERLRWFTREGSEVQSLCGHGTVAAAHVCLRLEPQAPATVIFDTRAGMLLAERDDARIAIDFPRWPVTRCDPPPGLSRALRRDAEEYWSAGRDYLAVFASETDVRALEPDFEHMKSLGRHGFIATARGSASGYDCVSRFFCPSFGIGENEDSVTGSAHCSIAPFWAERLGKPEIRAYQASARGGDLVCRVKPGAVRISTLGTIFLKGTLSL